MALFLQLSNWCKKYRSIKLQNYAQIKKEQDITPSEYPLEQVQPGAGAVSDDETAIRALTARFAAAFNAGDIEAIMNDFRTGKLVSVSKP